MNNEIKELIEEKFASLAKELQNQYQPQFIRIRALEITAGNISHLATTAEDLVSMANTVEKYIMNDEVLATKEIKK